MSQWEFPDANGPSAAEVAEQIKLPTRPYRCWPWRHHWHVEWRMAEQAPNCMWKRRVTIVEWVCCKCLKAEMQYYRTYKPEDDRLIGRNDG